MDMGQRAFPLRVRQRTGLAPVEPGFTLTELMIVVGLVALLAALLLPVFGRMRAASASVRCASNLRQMTTAWAVYTADNQGRFIDYAFFSSPESGVAWNKYWPGILDQAAVRGTAILCPAADNANPTDANFGYGSATAAWTGSVGTAGTVIRFDATQYRESSYGFNRYLSVGWGYSNTPGGERISNVRRPVDTPVFLDAAYLDVRPVNGSKETPVASPPNLRGDALTRTSPEHWLFLLARHGRGVNVAMADGSVRWVSADDLYTLAWKANWTKYHLILPGF
jgi:prepilin-type processing-associated H-X9-DG protein/prepilin-type N-terminal cleavage/methylation domain-containing protein